MLGNNMFAYCRNNPVNREDAQGTEDLCSTSSEDDDNIFNDMGSVRGGGGGASGGFLGGGSGNSGSSSGGHGGPPKPNAADSPIFSPDQQAVLDLAKENKNGLSYDNANLLYGWAREYGISGHGPMIHQGRGGAFSGVLHIKIKNYHIAVFGGNT